MEASENKRFVYEFGEFLLDPYERTLSARGKRLHLAAKEFDTLLMLVEHCGRALTKEEMIAAIWPDAFVEESSLAKQISRLRKILNTNGNEFIETLPKRGYRFSADLRRTTIETKEPAIMEKTERVSFGGPDEWFHSEHEKPVKYCPQCRRGYTDSTLNFCLDDGQSLVGGPSLGTESATAVLSASRAPEVEPDIEDERTVLPAKSKRRFLPIALAGLVLIGLTVVGSYLYYGRGTTTTQIDSLAVLPFENGTGDSNMDYLSDGLSESLIDKLWQLPKMKVISRSSSFKYRGPNIDPQEVANRLGVQAVVMGKVDKQGDQLAVRVEMVDARDNKQLWGERYVRKSADAMAIQQEIAQTVSNKLSLRLSGAQEKQLASVGTSNPQAYEYYLKGIFFRAKSGNEHLKASNQFFRQAAEADPGYAAAHANLAISYLILAGNGIVNPADGLPKAESAARRAMELDGSIAESHLALAGVNRDRWKWKDAEQEYEVAVGLNPNMAEARRRYSQLLSLMGRHDEAVKEVVRARDLDPLSPRINVYVAYAYHFARRYDEGIAAARKALELDPDYGLAYILLGYIYSAKGQYQQAVESYKKAIELDRGGTSTQIYLGAAYAGAGERETALEILDNLRNSKEYVSPGELPALLAALGMTEEVFASFEKAFAAHDLQLQYIKIDPAFDPLRDDPRFADLVRRVGLP